MSALSHKHILLGVTGGIAAYKSAELIRRFREKGVDVRVVMTEAAKEFITPLTLQALSGNPIHHDLFDLEAESAMGHIELARWADVILIAPASADFIANLTHGQANNLLTTLCLATKAPIAVAPAMNQNMWHAKSTQENIKILKNRDIKIFGPAEGSQACGDVGLGRLLEPNDIVLETEKLFSSDILSGKHIVITAGPTQEAIDPVRYISNHSSGKMAYALAQSAIEAGAHVTLISGSVCIEAPERAEVIHIKTAEEMLAATLKQTEKSDIFISAAAVVDYRCDKIADKKIAKDNETLTLKLIRNPDILKTVAAQKNKPFCVGFAAETDDVIKKAKQKLQNKKCDMIIANQVGMQDRGFNSDNNACTVITKNNELELPLASKKQLAKEIIQLIAKNYEKHTSKNIK